MFAEQLQPLGAGHDLKIPLQSQVQGGGCKVTGGGVFMLNGTRQTFGFIAGSKDGISFFGNFNYVDHGNPGAHLQGPVDSVIVDPSNSSIATIGGDLKTGGRFEFLVVDSDEPGRAADTFLLFTPVSTGTILLDGGNIQIHKGSGCVGSSR